MRYVTKKAVLIFSSTIVFSVVAGGMHTSPSMDVHCSMENGRGSAEDRTRHTAEVAVTVYVFTPDLQLHF